MSTNSELFSKFYPAKLLLLGEHTVLLGSEALAVPIPKLGGRWQPVDASKKLPEHLSLHEFWAYLAKMPQFSSILSDDTGGGHFSPIFFKSNIPRGYGAGSSGALTAAALDCLAMNGAKIPTDLAGLKQILGEMESHFHGASSGLDPLVSFKNQPIWIQSDGKMSVFETELPFKNHIFLVDTHRQRKAENMIRFFKENVVLKHENRLKSELVPAVEQAIRGFKMGDEAEIWVGFDQISAVQFDICQELIPIPFQNIWKMGLASDAFRLKLCGAGGGGYILGFARDHVRTREIFKEFGFELIQPF